MKNAFLAAMFLLIASSAHADERKAEARLFNCSELQQLLQDEGKLYIITNRLGWGNTHSWTATCPAGKEPNSAYVVTQDKFFCLVGYVCQKR